MLIQSDGKVGIGTDSPVASALEVQGEFGISDGSGAVTVSNPVTIVGEPPGGVHSSPSFNSIILPGL